MSSKTNKANSSLFASRRNLVRSIAMGSGVVTGLALLPDKWTKPVVEAVYLPAHAQTSAPENGTPTPTSTVGATPTPTSTPAGVPTPTNTPIPPTPTNTPVP